MAVRFIILVLFLSLCNAEPVRKKNCKNVDNSHCAIHNVNIDPCPDGPAFCFLRRGKPYNVAVDYTPRFSANNLKVSIRADDAKNNTFNSEILAPTDSCQSDCAIEENSRRQLNVNFMFDKKTHGKFPIQVKLWNAEDENQTCCFTFNVRMLKFRRNA